MDKPEPQTHIPNKDKLTGDSSLDSQPPFLIKDKLTPDKEKLTPNKEKLTPNKDTPTPNKEKLVFIYSPDGPFIIDNPQGYKFTYNSKTKTISINGKAALLKPIEETDRWGR